MISHIGGLMIDGLAAREVAQYMGEVDQENFPWEGKLLSFLKTASSAIGGPRSRSVCL